MVLCGEAAGRESGGDPGKKVEMHWLPFELNADMPVDGLDRRVYRSAKFGSWEHSQRLDAQVAAAGAEVGITFHHDRMKRTPNTLRGHVLLAAALKQGLEMQGKVAERLFRPTSSMVRTWAIRRCC